jgi:hypothetical protein
MTYRERLLRLLIKEGLAKEGDRIHQIYASDAQRCMGAANWNVGEVYGFDTMRACAERGIVHTGRLRDGSIDVFAKEKDTGERSNEDE